MQMGVDFAQGYGIAKPALPEVSAQTAMIR